MLNLNLIYENSYIKISQVLWIFVLWKTFIKNKSINYFIQQAIVNNKNNSGYDYVTLKILNLYDFSISLEKVSKVKWFDNIRKELIKNNLKYSRLNSLIFEVKIWAYLLDSWYNFIYYDNVSNDKTPDIKCFLENWEEFFYECYSLQEVKDITKANDKIKKIIKDKNKKFKCVNWFWVTIIDLHLYSYDLLKPYRKELHDNIKEYIEKNLDNTLGVIFLIPKFDLKTYTRYSELHYFFKKNINYEKYVFKKWSLNLKWELTTNFNFN